MTKLIAALATTLAAVAAGQPTSSAVAAPGCARPSARAHTLHAVAPKVSAAAAKHGTVGTVWVAVRIDAFGKPQDAAIRRSTNPRLNDAAIQSSLASTYAPAIRECRPIASAYIYTVAVESL
jgi:Gram-negative bacterial TonB protein C-terminal